MSNKNKEGIYEQIYKINLEQYKEYSYVLLIYNVDFNKTDLVETIKLQTKSNVYLTENQIILEIIKQLNIKVFNYQMIENDYLESSEAGKYYQSYIITSTTNNKINVLVEIEVINSNSYLIPALIGGTILVSIGVIVISIKRRKKG